MEDIVLLLILSFMALSNAQSTAPKITFACSKTGDISEIKKDDSLIAEDKLMVATNPERPSFCRKSDSNCGPLQTNILLRIQDDTSSQVLGGKNYHVYKLSCINTGIYQASIVPMNIDGPTPVPSTVTALIPLTITLSLVDSANKPKQQIYLGEELFLKMTIEDGFKLLPTNCTAKSLSGKENYPIWNSNEASCTKDPSIMDPYWRGSGKDLSIKMYAFRFQSSKTVNIECFTKVCKSDDSTECVNTCTEVVTTTPLPTQPTLPAMGNQRRRRDIVTKPKTPTYKIKNARVSFDVIDLFTNGGTKGMMNDSSTTLIVLLALVTLTKKLI